MKSAIIIVLIVIGAGLIVAPLIADYQLKTTHQANVVRLLEKSEAQRVTLMKDEMHTGLSFGCWLTGALLAGTGVYLALREARSASPPSIHPPSL
jgi:hypothetical protein